MKNKASSKYRPFPSIKLPNRQWPDKEVAAEPTWCEVGLRDGNQALQKPMDVETKLKMFNLLVACGFKEIEVGFPSSTETECAFVRKLIEENLIPDDVTIQVLVQSREDLVIRTVDSLMGAKKVVIHLYNSTSPEQRVTVFGLEKPEVLALAVRGTEWVKEYAKRLVGTEVTYQYSPESFSATEIDFSLEVCEAVVQCWNPSPEKKMVLNLPDTVEVASCKTYADQVEWIHTNLSRRDSVILSVHTHNDRGTGTAATELALCAGAERVEGTLFGNGERTGNQDLIITALNLHTQGVDISLDFSNLDEIKRVYEECTEMTVHARHPYSGDLVFTAFSGSHQDAIKKGLEKYQSFGGWWQVPYVPLDPADIGRDYYGLVRVNGQSGKGGVAFLLEREHGISIPKNMQREFGPIANRLIDKAGREVSSAELKEMFLNEYVRREDRYKLIKFFDNRKLVEGWVGAELCKCEAEVFVDDHLHMIDGEGNGPINAFVHALKSAGIARVEVIDYHAHALGIGSEALAISYVCVRFPDGKSRWGAGVDTDSEVAPIKAMLSALNRHV